MGSTSFRALAMASASVLLACAGCSLPGPMQPTGPPVPIPAASSAATGVPRSPVTSEPTMSSRPSPSALQASPGSLTSEVPVAVREGVLEGVPVVATMFEVRRNGATSVVNLSIRAKDEGDEFTIGKTLNDHDRDVSDSGNSAPDGIRLIDGARKLAYLPATTAGGTCVCARPRRTSCSWTGKASGG